MVRLFLALAAFAVPVAPASAQPAPSAASSPVDQALLDRFVAALPESREQLAALGEVDSDLLRRFTALNPGRDGDVLPLVQAYARCSAPALRNGTVRLIEEVGRQLGRERVERLIAFYGGPDFEAFARIAPSVQAGNPSAAESAELLRILTAYPLIEFRATMQRLGESVGPDDQFAAAITRCATTLRQALEARGLRVN